VRDEDNKQIKKVEGGCIYTRLRTAVEIQESQHHTKQNRTTLGRLMPQEFKRNQALKQKLTILFFVSASVFAFTLGSSSTFILDKYNRPPDLLPFVPKRSPL
jgi:hypothetical protein